MFERFHFSVLFEIMRLIHEKENLMLVRENAKSFENLGKGSQWQPLVACGSVRVASGSLGAGERVVGG